MKQTRMFANLEKTLYAVSLISMLTAATAGFVGCNREDDAAKKEQAGKKDVKKVFKTYGDFKNYMKNFTDQIVVFLMFTEGSKFLYDDKTKTYNYDVCVPYLDSKGIPTICFGITQLDGKSVTLKTPNVSLKRAWAESKVFCEDKETFFFMWCYDVAFGGLGLESPGRVFGLTSICYNSCTNLIEEPTDTNCRERSNALRELYKKYGEATDCDSVLKLFDKYPVVAPRSFGEDLMNHADDVRLANTVGNFMPLSEGPGMIWRRWLEGLMILGRVTPSDFINLPMGGMYEFFMQQGGESARTKFFKPCGNGRKEINTQEVLNDFYAWMKNPTNKNGKKTFALPTIDFLLNRIDGNLVANILNQSGKDADYVRFYNSMAARATHNQVVSKIRNGEMDTVRACEVLDSLAETQYNNASLQNDISFYRLGLGENKRAIKNANNALDMAATRQDSAAAYYNMGLAYNANEDFDDAVVALENSLQLQKNQRAKDLTSNALKDAMVSKYVADKEHEKRMKYLGVFAGGVLAASGAAIAIRRGLRQRGGKGRRR